MKITPHKFFVVSQSGWTIKMKPQKFPVLILEAFVIMVFHAIDIGCGSRKQMIVFTVIFQQAFSPKRINNKKTVQVFSFCEIGGGSTVLAYNKHVNKKKQDKLRTRFLYKEYAK